MYVRRLADTGVCTDSRSAEEMERMIREGLPQPWSEQVYRIDDRTIGIGRRDGGKGDPADVFRWEDPSESPSAVVFGKARTASVHMAYAGTGRLLCRSSNSVETVICGPCGMYPAPADDGLPGTIAALLQADVSPSRLCRACFYPKTVAIYAAAYREQAESEA
ncbi:hypothetical protein [Amycolatopsis kentuckyensis]|uniref:hypothetical protein n=1 Tax=Amycolatopsis kentuckyensis TaxID=218823 RepID=UPI003564698B